MKLALENVKQAIRNPYAWPGGYTTVFICADGGVICPTCARKEYKLIRQSMIDGYDDQWVLVDQDIMYENESGLTCDHCNEVLESAYGE